MLAARDLLGIKTLFYGRHNGTLYLASELKSLRAVTDDVHEFPPGHFMDAEGKLTCFAQLPKPPKTVETPLPQVIDDVRDIIERSVRDRVDFVRPTAALLSGGMDSSVISYLSSNLCKEMLGPKAKLKTFAMGVGRKQRHPVCPVRWPSTSAPSTRS